MNPLAANRTTAGPRPASRAGVLRCSLVEDLDWPATLPTPARKPARPTGMWMPGPNGQWEGVAPTLH